MSWSLYEIPSQRGKIAVVTGANVGLGLEITRILASKNVKVVMACRDIEKAEIAKKQLLETNPEAELDILHLDLSDLDQVHQFAEQVRLKYTRLDILINNAGVMIPPYTETKQGFELQFGVNHLGHFLLTALLFDLLKRTPGARVVPISSIAHKFGEFNFEDLNTVELYNKQKAYAQSKLANLMFAYELDSRFKKANLDIKCIAAHPGVSSTNLIRNFPYFLRKLTPFVTQTAAAGAQPAVMAAFCQSLEGGEFIGPSGLLEFFGKPKIVGSSKRSKDKELAATLWEKSEAFVKYKFDVA